MKRVMMYVFLLAIAPLIGGLMGWWGGTIILPEMGLDVPDYWTWFKFSCVTGLAAFLGGMVKGAFKVMRED